jgi:hypothetical protein
LKLNPEMFLLIALALGLLAAIGIGRALRPQSGCLLVIISFAISSGAVIFLMFGISLAYEYCVEPLMLCAKTSSETVWFFIEYPVLAFFVYWPVITRACRDRVEEPS